ncbi:MAG: PaaI family thioesterase, partial [Burkholderiales bacterium]|nr:PaaI family thioesterase [Burkholderiales bacterium]
MSETIPERLDARQLAEAFAASPFIRILSLEVLKIDYEKTELSVRMPLNAGLERRAGTRQFHGGPIASLIDVAGDFAIGMMIGGGVPTINLRIDYLKPAVGDALTATARVRRAGKTVAVVDIDVT